jgi:hypothetical protein
MISSLSLSMIFSENRFPLFRIMPQPAGPAKKSAVRQAVRRRNLRGKQGQRNAGSKLCTAKQLFGTAARCTALEFGDTDAIQRPFPLPTGVFRGHSQDQRIATKHLISGGFSS